MIFHVTGNTDVHVLIPETTPWSSEFCCRTCTSLAFIIPASTRTQMSNYHMLVTSVKEMKQPECRQNEKNLSKVKAQKAVNNSHAK